MNQNTDNLTDLEKNFFNRLGRLFSSNVIVRRINGGLKVIDTNRLQSVGNKETSRFIDRFSRLHGGGGKRGFTNNNHYNYHASKTEIYTDYECLAGDTVIPTPDSKNLTLKELSEIYPNKDTWFYVFSYDLKENCVKLGKAHSVRKTKTEKTYKITLDNGEFLVATANHPFLMRNGEYKRVSELKSGDIPMPFWMLSNFSHRISRIEEHEVLDVYDMTVEKYHNFATNYCFVHNSMDKDSIIAAALDIVADETTMKSPKGQVIEVVTEDETIKDLLENLLYDVMNIDFNLWPWVRQLAKYGDFYAYLHIVPALGIVNITPLSAYDISRIEGEDANNPFAYHFEHHIDRSPLTKGKNFENFEIAHFRLLTDANFLPYGRCVWSKSYIETEFGVKTIDEIQKGDKVWTYNIALGKFELAEVLAAVCSGVKEIKAVRTKNTTLHATDNHPVLTYDLSTNQMIYKQVQELEAGDLLLKLTYLSNPNDFLEPVTSVEPFKTDTVWDIQVSKNSNFVSDGVVVHNSHLEPARKTFKQLCLAGDTKITTPSGFKEIKDIREGETVYCFDYSTKKVKPTKVVKWKCNGIDQLYEVKTQYRSIKANATHPFMIQDGTYKRTTELTSEDSLVVPKIIQTESIIPNLVVKDAEFSVKLTEEGIRVFEEAIEEGKERGVTCKVCGKQLTSINKQHLKSHHITVKEYKETYQTELVEPFRGNRFTRGEFKWSCERAKEIANHLNIEDCNQYFQYYLPSSKDQIVYDFILKDNFTEFVRFVGFWLGDGWIDESSNSVCFSIGNRLDKSQKYLDFVKKLGVSYKIFKEGTPAATCCVYSKYFKMLCIQLGLKTGCMSKEIPSWIYKLSNKDQIEFLMGFIDADGCVIKEGRWRISGVNRNLIDSLRMLAHRNGLVATNIHKARFSELGFSKSEFFYNCEISLESKNRGILAQDVFIEKVKSVTALDRDYIYDIQVESCTHNFLGDCCVLHNTLMEDAMLVHRIMRAPEKRVFKIDVGNIPPHEVDNYMNKVIDQAKKVPYVDQQTGEYNLKYNMQNLLEDFYLPVRGGQSGTEIETLSGLNYDGIADVEYLRDKLLTSLKIPKAFLNYEADLGSKCVSPDTKIPLLSGEVKTVAELIEDFENGSKNYVYSINLDQEIVPGEIEWAGYTRKNAQVVKVWLDNDKFLITTPDHKFLTRDGVYIEAQYLEEGMSLMPLYLDDTQTTVEYKVSKVQPLEELIDTCDITIKEHHNFGTEAGVIIHNSTLACLTPDTKVPLLSGETKTIEEILEDFNNGISNYTYSFNTEIGEVVPGKISWVGYTRKDAVLVRVHLDNGKHIDCTPDHRFLKRDGSWVEAQDLKEGDSLRSIDTSGGFLDDLNHKVLRVETLEHTEDTCDLTIDTYHNFLTEAGVVVHNSEDVRFSRTIERFQKIVLSELKRICIIHLYSQGYENEALASFDLKMYSPSIIYEQERLSLITQQITLAKDIIDGKVYSKHKIYKEILNFSDDEIDEERARLVEDAKEEYILETIKSQGQVEEEGSEEDQQEPEPSQEEKPQTGQTEEQIGPEGGSLEGGQPGAGRPKEVPKVGSVNHPRGPNPLGSRARRDEKLEIKYASLIERINERFGSQIQSSKKQIL